MIRQSSRDKDAISNHKLTARCCCSDGSACRCQLVPHLPPLSVLAHSNLLLSLCYHSDLLLLSPAVTQTRLPCVRIVHKQIVPTTGCVPAMRLSTSTQCHLRRTSFKHPQSYRPFPPPLPCTSSALRQRRLSFLFTLPSHHARGAASQRPPSRRAVHRCCLPHSGVPRCPSLVCSGS